MVQSLGIAPPATRAGTTCVGKSTIWGVLDIILQVQTHFHYSRGLIVTTVPRFQEKGVIGTVTHLLSFLSSGMTISVQVY